jgi:hypothetical protein
VPTAKIADRKKGTGCIASQDLPKNNCFIPNTPNPVTEIANGNGTLLLEGAWALLLFGIVLKKELTTDSGTPP